MTGNAEGRSIGFERWWNVRDLGGLPTRDGGTTDRGVLVRAASPQFATPGDIERARDLGLTTFVDLRMPRAAPDWRADDPDMVTVGVDLVGSLSRPPDIAPEQVLPMLLGGARGQVAAAVREITRLAEEQPPVVFHCHTGKDRTGLVSLLLLRLADVPDDAIVGDYLASNQAFEEMRDTLLPESGQAFMRGAPAAVRGPVPRAGAEAGLRLLDMAGGAEAYLMAGGLDPREVERASGLLRSGP